MKEIDCRIEVNSHFSDDMIVQDTFHVRDDLRTNIGRSIINLRENGIREALIALGWTPPEGK